MSEVQDACQVIMVAGQGIYMIGGIAVEAAYEIMKLMNTIYLSKWEGVTNLNRFRAIKGDDYLFINVSTEDPAVLQQIEKEMEAHGILTARLPDLCGGDGRTQYAVSPSDASKYKAFLIDHANGKYRDIKVGEISPEDYAETRKNSKGEDTPEYRELNRSAKEKLEKQKQLGTKRPAGLLPLQKNSAHTWTFAGTRRAGRGFSSETAAETEEERTVFQPLTPSVKQQLARHDSQVNQDVFTLHIYEKPFKTHSRWKMFEMPDGIHAVIVPNDSVWEPAKGGIPCQAALQKGEYYDVIELETGKSTLLSADQVAEEMKGYGIRRENEQLKNLVNNRNLPAVITPRRDREENDDRVDGTLREAAGIRERENKTWPESGKTEDSVRSQGQFKKKVPSNVSPEKKIKESLPKAPGR